MKMKSLCLLLVVLCLFGSSVFADIIIMAVESCRTDVAEPDTNKHDSSKLSIRTSEGDGKAAKSWIKFDLGDLDVDNLESATLTVASNRTKDGNHHFDVSYVNDDCLDNIGWDERSITWNNAPGNDTADLGDLDTTKTTFLTTINFTDVVAGDQFTIDVLATLQADTDGIVQFVFHNSKNLQDLATHDHATVAWRPFIDATEIHKGATDPIPDGTVSVETNLAALSWTNPDPNDPLGSITCDVYFGTDPNRPQMDKVTLAPDASSVDINATNFPTFVPLANRTWYYWFVDCHDPSAGPDGQTFMPGSTWSFYTDDNQQPVVDLGDDLVAWLGMSGTPDEETIALIPVEVSDDGLPDDQTLTVEWTQVANGAPDATINSPNDEVTSVTVTARGVYEFMLTANDGAKETQDTVQVFVGTDPCDASHMSTGDPYKIADENEDCIVDLGDFAAIIAANWLDCSDTLTNCGN